MSAIWAQADQVGVDEVALLLFLVVGVGDVAVSVEEATQRGGGDVVLFADDRSGAGFGDQFLLRQEQVDLQ